MPNTRDTMGEQACLDALVAGTLNEIVDDSVTTVGSYALLNGPASVSFPNATSIPQNAFRGNTALVSASLPSATYVGTYALSGCSGLAQVSLDNVVRIYEHALDNTAVTALSLPKCNNIDAYGLANCPNLEDLLLGGTGSISFYAYATSGDVNLKHIRLPNISSSAGTWHSDFFPRSIDGLTAIYVPSAMVDSMRSAKSGYAKQIRDIAEYPLSDLSTITDSWDQIIAACQDGTYSSKYELGATKRLTIGNSDYMFVLVGKDSDVLASDGTTTVPTTWLAYARVYDTSHRMTNSGTSGGWESSEMRAWLESDILPSFPSNVREAIKTVRKTSSTYSSSIVRDGCVTSDKLWIPSSREVSNSSVYEATGPTYSGANIFGMKRYASSNGAYVASDYWLRSAQNAQSFRMVNNSGSESYNTAYTKYGVVLGFCI